MKFVPSLNSLRFFGATAVLLTHLGSYEFLRSLHLEKLYALISGGIGIDLFFVLSGFLLTSNAIREVRTTSRFAGWRFFKRRILRLFPLYFFAIGVLLILQAFGAVHIRAVSYVYAALYSYNMVPRWAYAQQLGPFHTLATEEQFYLLFGILFIVFAAVAKVRALIYLPMIFLALLVTSTLIQPLFSHWNDKYFVDLWTPFTMRPILVGVLGAFLFHSEWWTKISEWFEAQRGRGPSLSTYLLLLALVVYLNQILFPNTLIASAGFVVLMWGLVMRPEGRFSRIISVRWLVYLGTISYGLYVWGAVIIGTGPASWLVPNPALALACVVLASIGSYELFEKRFVRLGKK